jgi:selenocysteine lyase/cysteine desulfurase
MHSAGRLRIAVHGYNTAEDIDRMRRALARLV